MSPRLIDALTRAGGAKLLSGNRSGGVLVVANSFISQGPARIAGKSAFLLERLMHRG